MSLQGWGTWGAWLRQPSRRSKSSESCLAGTGKATSAALGGSSLRDALQPRRYAEIDQTVKSLEDKMCEAQLLLADSPSVVERSRRSEVLHNVDATRHDVCDALGV